MEKLCSKHANAVQANMQMLFKQTCKCRSSKHANAVQANMQILSSKHANAVKQTFRFLTFAEFLKVIIDLSKLNLANIVTKATLRAVC